MIHTIEIRHHAFAPSSVTISIGDQVQWSNFDATRHSARHDVDPVFDTGLISSNTTTAPVTFTKVTPAAGIIYYCEPHPHMTGVIIVR